MHMKSGCNDQIKLPNSIFLKQKYLEISQGFHNIMVPTALVLYKIVKYKSNLYQRHFIQHLFH